MKRLVKGCNHTSKAVGMADGGMVGMAGKAAQQKGMQRAQQGTQRAMSGPPARPNPKTQGPAAGGQVQRRFADGGAVHGSPMSTPKPGGTTRRRPRPGDKDPNYTPPNSRPRRPRSSRPAPNPKPSGPSYPHRDYRGTEGAIDDATGNGKK